MKYQIEQRKRFDLAQYTIMIVRGRVWSMDEKKRQIGLVVSNYDDESEWSTEKMICNVRTAEQAKRLFESLSTKEKSECNFVVVDGARCRSLHLMVRGFLLPASRMHSPNYT